MMAAAAEDELLGRPGSASFNRDLQRALDGAASGRQSPVRDWARFHRAAITRAIHTVDDDETVRALGLTDAELTQAVGFTRALSYEYRALPDARDEADRRAGAIRRASEFLDQRPSSGPSALPRVLSEVLDAFTRTGQLGKLGTILARGGPQCSGTKTHSDPAHHKGYLRVNWIGDTRGAGPRPRGRRPRRRRQGQRRRRAPPPSAARRSSPSQRWPCWRPRRCARPRAASRQRG